MYTVSQDYLDALDLPVQIYRITGTVGAESFTESNIVKGKLKITNKVSEGSEVKIGSVYVGELRSTFTGMSITRGQWVGKVISLSEGLYLPDETFEDVPLGIYTIAEAKHTLEGVEVIAYDSMADFDKTFSIDQTNGSPYDLLSLACSECGVTLGNTQAEVEALPNGTETFYLYSENDIETWRDFVSWIAQTLASVATIDRTGKLVLRQYSIISSMTIDEEHRFSGCAFSDFATHYTGCSVVDVEQQEVRYKSVSPDDGLTYNLGSNPFLQADDGTMQQALINSFSTVELVPFTAQMLGGAIFDLGDCLTFSGGVANGATCGVMGYSYSYNGGYKVEGYGMNPALANARSKTDKELAGITSGIDLDKPRIFAYTNSTAVTIADGDEETVAYLHVVAKKLTRFVLQLEVNHLAETTEIETASTYTNTDLNITGKIYINDELQDFSPVEVEQDGTQGYFLTFTEQVPQQGMEVRVDLACSGGSISVAIGDVQAYLMGPGFDDFKIESITITSLPNNLFPYGLVNYDGLVIDGVFNDGSQLDVTDDCAITPSEGTAISGDAEVVHMTANYNNGQFTEEFDAPVNPLFTFYRQHSGLVWAWYYAGTLERINGELHTYLSDYTTSGSTITYKLRHSKILIGSDNVPTTDNGGYQKRFNGTSVEYYKLGTKMYADAGRSFTYAGTLQNIGYYDFTDKSSGEITPIIHDDPAYASERTFKGFNMPIGFYPATVIDGVIIWRDIIYAFHHTDPSYDSSATGWAYGIVSGNRIDIYFKQGTKPSSLSNYYGYKFTVSDGQITVKEIHFDTTNLITTPTVGTIDLNVESVQNFQKIGGTNSLYVLNYRYLIDSTTWAVVDDLGELNGVDKILYLPDKGVYVRLFTDTEMQYYSWTPCMEFSYDLKTWYRGGYRLTVAESTRVSLNGSYSGNILEEDGLIVGTCFNQQYDQIAFTAHIDAEV